MVAMKLLLTVSTYLYFVHSEPCIPADTCFAISSGNSISAFDKSFKMECLADGTVAKHIYNGATDCSGGNHATSYPDESQGTITSGDIQSDGLGSGGIITSYLQGSNCYIDAASDSCTEYMVLKHRGNRNHQVNGVSTPFGDMGDNCTAYIGNEATFTQYETVVAPVGCVNLASVTPGSHLYECDENGWSFKHYELKGILYVYTYTHFAHDIICTDCQGGILSAQSGAYSVDKCGYFSEWTHCNSVETGQTSGCVNDGVHVYFWYWYDLEYCPTSANHGGSNSGGNSGNTGSGTTTTTTTSSGGSNSGGSGSGTASTTQASNGSGSGTGTGTGTGASTTSANGSGSGSGTASTTGSSGTGASSTQSNDGTNDGNNSNNGNGTDNDDVDGTNEGSTVSENFGSDFWWWWIVVIALVVCCLCIACIGFFTYRKKRGDQYFGSGF